MRGKLEICIKKETRIVSLWDGGFFNSARPCLVLRRGVAFHSNSHVTFAKDETPQLLWGYY